MQVTVLLAGRLRGMGMEGECDLMAKRNLAEPGGYAYTDPVVIRAPAHFPDGDYSLMVEGEVLSVVHHGVLWTVRTDRFGDHSGKALAPSAIAAEPSRMAAPAARERKRAKAQASAGSATG